MVTLIAPRKTVATATVSASLARGSHTPVDATSGALTMTLPTNAAVGVEISVEKVDASVNAVTISGTLRGSASTISLTSQYEARTFLSEGGGSWRPTSDHRPKTSLDAAYARKGPEIDVRDFGSVVTASTVNAAMAAAASRGGYGRVLMPGGLVLLDAKITLLQGVLLDGGGGHDSASRPGTEFRPASGYTGVGFHYPPDGANLWHHGGLQRIRVKGFASHGIHIEGGMGEISVIDEVMSASNGGDGIRIEGASTPSMLGRLAVHSNAAAGLRLVAQTETHTQVEYVGGDNNGEALITIDGLDTTSSVQVLGWKAERYGASAGHPDVFVINNGNGSYVDLGQGRVQVGTGAAASTGSIVKQTGTPARLTIAPTLHTATGTSYANGYNDVLNGKTFSVTDVTRQKTTVGAPPRYLMPLNGPGVLLGPSATSPGLYEYSGNPENIITANPGSLCLAETGGVYRKYTGTGATGWRNLFGADVLAAKGSLIVGAGSTAGGNFGSGADFTVLTVDNNQTFGMRWNPSGGRNYDNAGRPSPSVVPIGTIIFNTQTGIPNWSNGTSWVNASGVVV